MQESPECIPASSICSIIPAMNVSLPSEIASTSTSMHFLKNYQSKLDYNQKLVLLHLYMFVIDLGYVLFP